MPRSDVPAIILCDFDGTITVDDMTNVIWDRFLKYDWRTQLFADFAQGQINATELVRRGYGDVQQSADEILSVMRKTIQIRSGFEGLLALCQKRQWRFAVVSNGLRFYIEAALPPHTEIWAHEASFDGKWQIELPRSIRVDASGDFKSQVIARIKDEHPHAVLVYLGDGRLDYVPAQLCHRIFSVRGSELERLCSGSGIVSSSFADFDEVVAELEGPSALGHGNVRSARSPSRVQKC